MKDWYLLKAEAVLEQLQTSLSGLSDEEASRRRAQIGRNELRGSKQKTRLQVFMAQFKDLMILLLAGAAIISLLSGEFTDAWVILAIIFGNAIIGYVQEYRAENSVRKLQQMVPAHAIAIRSGVHKQIDAADLVPGDLIFLEAGNQVPADARLLSASGLKVEEAALTGESATVDKSPAALSGGSVLPADQLNMIFKGTYISNGTGTAVVTATGMQTEIGKIAGLLEGGSTLTPLQQRLARFGRQMAVIVLIISAILFIAGLLSGQPPLSMFLTAMSLAVAALPEALPVVVTIALAGGASRMVRQQALVRKLAAVETLGSVSYICTDKTGTLTLNKMTVEHIEAEGGQEDLLLSAMALNHEVKVSGQGILLGDATEIALIAYAAGKGTDWIQKHQAWPLADKVPFDSDRMLMTTVHQVEGGFIVLVKGAPVRILEKLHSRHQSIKEAWQQRNREWAERGYRVLFFAFKRLQALPDQAQPGLLEADLDMLGLAALIDPPREEVIEAIQSCHEAGIATVMITGDQPLTAASIARRLRILQHEGEKVVTGPDLLGMNQPGFAKVVRDIRVYARVSPEQKLRIVKELQATGVSVAMTGDGVNDAPSLRQADIGVAMGITGTDVAKEAAHMVLLDDNFATIVKAVREGRRIYDNIRKFVRYILSCNLGELITILAAPLFGMPIPLLPIHILWINLVTDGLPGLALASEPEERGIMKRPPRSAFEHLFARGMIVDIISSALILATGALLTQYIAVREGFSVTVQQTMVFSVLCFVQLGNALSIRAGRYSLFSRFWRNRLLLGAVLLTVLLQLSLIYIRPLSEIFKISSLDREAIRVVCYVSLASVGLLELVKLIRRQRNQERPENAGLSMRNE